MHEADERGGNGSLVRAEGTVMAERFVRLPRLRSQLVREFARLPAAGQRQEDRWDYILGTSFRS